LGIHYFGNLDPPDDYDPPKRKAPTHVPKDVLPSEISGLSLHTKGTDHYKTEFEKVEAENIFPLNMKGASGNSGLMPTIIKEIYFQPKSPLQV